MYDRIVRIKRTNYYIPETIFGLVVLVTINLIFIPSRPAFMGIAPNPLWIIVLPIAARYGRNGAMFAGVMTSLVFAAHYIILGGLDVFYDDLWLLRFPFLFMLVGFLIGEVRTVFILREDYLTKRVEELENMNDGLEKENEIIKEAHKDLSVDVATKQDTITILNEISQKLKSSDPEVIHKNILDCFMKNLEADECSFYINDGGTLKLSNSEGWKDYYKRPETYTLGQGLIGLSAKLMRTLNIKDIILNKVPLDEEQSDMIGESVLAVPLIGIEQRLYGIASIDKIPLLKLTESTIQTANVICDLAASSLNNVYIVKGLEEKQIKEKEHNLYKYHYFLLRVNEEFLRSLNYMIPLSAMAFKWTKLSTLPDVKRNILIDSTVELLNKQLRTFDVIAQGPNDEIPIVLLLATTSGPQAENLKGKITEHMKKYEFDKVVCDGPIEESIIVSAFNPHTMKDGKDLIKPLGL